MLTVNASAAAPDRCPWGACPQGGQSRQPTDAAAASAADRVPEGGRLMFVPNTVGKVPATSIPEEFLLKLPNSGPSVVVSKAVHTPSG